MYVEPITDWEVIHGELTFEAAATDSEYGTYYKMVLIGECPDGFRFYVHVCATHDLLSIPEHQARMIYDANMYLANLRKFGGRA